MSYIVITGQIVGGDGKPFETAWSSDLEENTTLNLAISHGFKVRGSDDFRIGLKRGNRLVQLSFMGTKQFSGEEIKDTAKQIGLDS